MSRPRALGWALALLLWIAVIVPVVAGRVALLPAAVLLTVAMLRRHRDASEVVGIGIGLGIVALTLGFVFGRYEPCSVPSLDTPAGDAPNCGFFDPRLWYIGGAMLLGASTAVIGASMLDARAD